MTTLPARGSLHSPDHLIPGATPVSSRRLPAPAGHHGLVLNHTVERGSSGQSAIISGFHLSPILGRPSLAKAAATQNPHRPTAHRYPAGSFFGGFPTPAPITRSIARAGPASETLHETGHWARIGSTGQIDPKRLFGTTIGDRLSGMARISATVSSMKSITMARRHAYGC